jgi:hypothetical protein
MTLTLSTPPVDEGNVETGDLEQSDWKDEWGWMDEWKEREWNWNGTRRLRLLF